MTNLSNPQRLVIDAVEMAQSSTEREMDENGRRWIDAKGIEEATEMKSATARQNAKRLVEMGVLVSRPQGKRGVEFALAEVEAPDADFIEEQDAEEEDPFEVADAGLPVPTPTADDFEHVAGFVLAEEPRGLAAVIKYPAAPDSSDFDLRAFIELQSEQEGRVYGGLSTTRAKLLRPLVHDGADTLEVRNGRDARNLRLMERYGQVAILDAPTPEKGKPVMWKVEATEGGRRLLIAGSTDKLKKQLELAEDDAAIAAMAEAGQEGGAA